MSLRKEAQEAGRRRQRGWGARGGPARRQPASLCGRCRSAKGPLRLPPAAPLGVVQDRLVRVLPLDKLLIWLRQLPYAGRRRRGGAVVGLAGGGGPARQQQHGQQQAGALRRHAGPRGRRWGAGERLGAAGSGGWRTELLAWPDASPCARFRCDGTAAGREQRLQAEEVAVAARR